MLAPCSLWDAYDGLRDYLHRCCPYETLTLPEQRSLYLELMHAEITCAYPAALEAHRLILTRERVTVNHAHALIREVLEAFAPVMPTREDADAAQESLRRFSDQKITLTDATIAAMARRERRQVFTHDERQRHFQLMGAQVFDGRAGT